MDEKHSYRIPPLSSSLIPVYVSSEEAERRHQSTFSQQTLWETCRAWVQYHSVQMRWDIERTLAHLLRRRWRR